jgi:arsenite oxidase small subunit
MDRRDFLSTCSTSAACITATAAATISLPSFAADAKPKAYARVLLTDERGDPFKAARLAVQTNYVFHYPFEATPVFLLNLGKPAPAHSLTTKTQDSYAWPGGVGPGKAVVAFSAICAHHLVYPTKDVSFISFRKGAARNAQTPSAGNDLIHCCADHSQYDPAQGAKVLRGPATQPLCAVLLEHHPKDDTLTAYATLGGELFDDFFKKYEAKLSIDIGSKAKNTVQATSTVRELEKFCRNSVKC